MFVPSGWYHQVWNLDDTISVNHNWFNGCNIDRIWQILNENYEKVCEEIADCRSMDAFQTHCQIMLKASHGMNFQDFLNLLKVIAKNRKIQLQQNCANDIRIGRNHCEFDLKQISTVIENICEKCQNLEEISEDILKMCKEIKNIIG